MSAIEVEGLLQSNPGAVKSPDRWHLVLHLLPWRRLSDSALVEELLRLELSLDDAHRETAMEALNTGDPVRLRVEQLTPPGDRGQWFATGTSPSLCHPPSPLLAAAGEALKCPVVIKDTELGELTLDRECNWFVGRRCGPEICITRSTSSADSRSDVPDVDKGRAVILRIESRMPLIRESIATSLLGVYNEEWREDGPALSSAEFLARIKLTTVVVYPTGSSVLYHGDGGLFGDHCIEVRLDEHGQVAEVCVSG